MPQRVPACPRSIHRGADNIWPHGPTINAHLPGGATDGILQPIVPRQPLALSTVFSALVALQATAADAAEGPVSAQRISEGSIQVDGSAADPGWSTAARYDRFLQREPYEGLPSSPTDVRVAYDDQALYVLVEAFDEQPESIVGRSTRRDESSTSDWIHLWLATNEHDDRFAYRFSVNAAKVKQDARLIDGSTEDLSFDAVWNADITRHARGWTAEFRIPFSQLAYTSRPNFRLQIVRSQARTGEQSTLFPYPRSATFPVRYMRPLVGLKGLPNPIHAELLPYASAAAQSSDWTAKPELRVGGDLKLALSPEVTLKATVLPDFGQVEADPSELNLSVYETYLAEKRPFFLDGGDALGYTLRQGASTDKLFYSRRIGQPPRMDPGVDPEQILDYPTNTPILFATNLATQNSQGYTVGVLQATTDEAFARVRTADGTERVIVAPMSQYFVARGTKAFGSGRTNVGAAVTTVNRNLGQELQGELAKNATTVGLDLEHRSKSVRLTAKVFASRIEGSPEAIEKLQTNSVHYFQRPDAHHVTRDPSLRILDGYGVTVVGSKFTGTPWRASWGGTAISPGFDPNDLGFLQRADDINAFGYLQYLVDEPTPLLRSYSFDANAWSNFTFSGEPTTRALSISASWVTRNTSTARIALQRDTDRLDPRALRGGSSMRIPGKFSASISASTDDRRSLALDAGSWVGRNDGNAAYWVGGQLALRVRPASFVQLAVGPYYQRALEGWAYLELADSGNPIVARLPRDVVTLTVRANVAITPELTLQLYSMPYLTAGIRSHFAEVVAPKSRRFSDHFAPIAYDGDRQFWYGQARTNAVMRWEYVPGSSLFLVWSREQQESSNERGQLRLGQDLARLWSAPSTDTVLLKWSHWLAF